MKRKNNLTKKIVTTALLIALNVVLTRFCAINTMLVKIGFGFLPVALCAILYGPAWAAVCAGAGDFFGVILFPVGAFNPAFTVSAALAGAVYGWALHRDEVGKLQITAAVVVNCLILSLVVNTFFIYWFFGVPFRVVFLSRIIQNCVMIPIQSVLIWFLVKTPAFRQILGEYGAA